MFGGITINSNLASLTTQRRLSESTSLLSKSLSRLSSGLRINRASDDSAGLAISESLNADTRVLTQGVRNLNDAVSLLQIAEGALNELSAILIREGELAEQAANGTLSLTQRRALNGEADALRDEFNRIVASTKFNGKQLLDCSSTRLTIQAGYGTNGCLSFGLAEELARTVGDTTFGTTQSQGASSSLQELMTGDFNSDGNLDAVFSSGTIHFGNGDGSFQGAAALPGGGQDLAAADFNGDGHLDIAAVTGNQVGVMVGDGQGNFSIVGAATVGANGTSIAAADLNGDGVIDLATSDAITSKVNVLFGRGDGTFGIHLGGGSYTADAVYSVGTTPYSIAVGDFNGDGAKDLTTGNDGQGAVSVLLNGGNGSFGACRSYAAVATQTEIVVGDLNADGIDDIVAANDDSSGLYVLLGNTNGSFRAAVTYQQGLGPLGLALGDLNGDRVLDLVTANYGDMNFSVLVGRGDGTFANAASYAAEASPPQSGVLGDFNNDGALDVVMGGATFGGLETHLANTTTTTSIGRLNLNTQAYARQEMGIIKAGLVRVNSELCAIGAVQSRIATAVSALRQSTENYVSARSRITDADVAEESALVVRNQILQQAGAAILDQANQAPELALLLLNEL